MRVLTATAILCLIGILPWLAGCQRAPEGTTLAGDSISTLRDTSPGDEAPIGPIVRDRETGCEYIGYTSHGLTPRMGRYEDGVQKQMGCFETLHMVNPVEGLDK